MKKSIYLSIFMLAFGNFSQAQITLASDINPGAGSSAPQAFTPFNGKLYMITDLPDQYGRELFNYDGSNPASLVYDQNPGTNDGVQYVGTESLPVLNNRLYFTGNSDATGYELMSIGTSGAPTLAGPELNVGSGSAPASYLTALGGKIYFSAFTAATGQELFVHDPVANTTVLVLDIMSGTGSSYPSSLVAYDGKLYFAAATASSGSELRCYNPSTNAVSLVSEISPAAASSTPENLTVIGDKLYFLATNAAFGKELYRYDGTTVTRCTDNNPEAADGVNYFSNLYKDEIYFMGKDGTANTRKLFAYNPSTNTTVLKYIIDPSINDLAPTKFTIYGEKLYFFAKTAANGTELWVTDGQSTNMVQDLEVGTGSGCASSYKNMMVWNDKLYFTAKTTANGEELFELNTQGGTSIRNLAFQGNASLAPNPTNGKASLFLDLDEAQSLQISITDLNGREVYQSAIMQYQSGKQETILPTESFSTGNYFYKITNAKGGVLLSGKLTKL